MLGHYTIPAIESRTLLLLSISEQRRQERQILGADSRTSVAAHKTIKKEQRVVSTYVDAQIDMLC